MRLTITTMEAEQIILCLHYLLTYKLTCFWKMTSSQYKKAKIRLGCEKKYKIHTIKPKM